MSSIDDSEGRRAAIAIIPVRGGSKGLPGKNLRLLLDKPLLWYTARASLDSRLITSTVISTESDEIAEYADTLGVTVLRHPPELSDDNSPTYPVVRWAVDQWSRMGNTLDYCVVLRATTPLRTADDIDKAVKLLDENSSKADSVVSVRAAVGMHPMRLKRIMDGWLVDAFESEGYSPKQRQELEVFFVRNGGIYAAKHSTIESYGLWGDRCLPYVMADERSININSDFDFKIAELLLKSQIACEPAGHMESPPKRA